MKGAAAVIAIAAVVSGAACGQAAAQSDESAHSAQVDSLFERWDRAGSPGCAVVVVDDGGIVHMGFHGSALVEHGIPIGRSTVFDLASLSKHFTGAAVSLLVADGVLSLDDPVRRWVPELPAVYEPVRLRNLVHHTSGVREFFTLWGFAGRDVESRVADEEVLAMLARQAALDFAPGERESYSNSNYFLLAEIVERAAGTSLDALLRERLLAPLGMTSTRFVDDHEDIVPNLAEGYFAREDGTIARRVLKNDVVGDSGLHSTIDDMARWMIALLADRGVARGLLATLSERGTLGDGTTIGYARGLRIMPMRGIETVSHGGTMGGFRTYMVLVPEDDWGTVVLCNQLDTSPFRLTSAITEIWFESRMTPGERTDVSLGPPGDEESRPSGDPVPMEILGRWWSEELEAYHEFAMGQEGLTVRLGDLPPAPLVVVGPDLLEGEGVRWRIERGRGGAVERIVLESGRASGVVLGTVGESAQQAESAEGVHGPRLVVPRGTAPRLDGAFGDAEWSGGIRVDLNPSGHGWFVHDGERLYVEVQGPDEGWAHVYLSWGDTVRVLHASAALGSIRYVRGAEGMWRTDEEFVYELRDRSLSPAAVEAREDYLAEHGWVASVAMMGDPGVQEFAIDLGRLGQDVRIAILHASDPAAPTGWPQLVDGTREPVLVRGDATSPLAFEPERWARIELAE